MELLDKWRVNWKSSTGKRITRKAAIAHLIREAAGAVEPAKTISDRLDKIEQRLAAHGVAH